MFPLFFSFLFLSLLPSSSVTSSTVDRPKSVEFLSLAQTANRTVDRLNTGDSLSLNQTLVSANGTFAVGFVPAAAGFLAAVFYHNHPSTTPVWVANKDTLLTDRAGVLTVTPDGNLAVVNGKSQRIWSTGLKLNGAITAIILDSGNLVLRRNDTEIWQSFDHPTDTLLPGMKLRLNKTNGEATKLRSNEFIFTLERRWGLETLLYKGNEVRWRGPMWLGIPILPLQLGDMKSRYIQTVHATDDEIYYTYTMEDSGLLVRYLLGGDGTYRFLVWDSVALTWNASGIVPSRPCDFYNRCGHGASCDPTAPAERSCQCLDGFETTKGNFSEGCVPRRRLACDGTDEYKKVGGMKLPDGYSVTWDLDFGQCRDSCNRNCSCRGFSHVNFSTFNMSGARCLTWMGEMGDIVQVPLFSQEFYLRLATTELEDGVSLIAPASSPRRNDGKMRIWVPVAVSVGLLLGGVLCCLVVCRLRSRERRDLLPLEEMILASELAGEKGTLPMVDFKSVRAATGNFSGSHQLGSGGFGTVYKGRLKSGEEVAVKRLSKVSKQGSEEFANEVLLIAKLQHRNLVRLLSWCAHGDERILIYEFMPNKSLDNIIFDPKRSGELSWKRRFAIIKGVADGLHYLHLHSRMRVIHRDLKTNNILLDRDMNPKISDFGLARIFDMNQTEANTKRVVGTYGYMSPEYALDGVFSEKSDVFSFGVIVLEIITGKPCTGFYPYKNSLNLLGYAWQMWEEGRSSELLDTALDGEFDDDEVQRCLQLGLLCVQEFAADRPTVTAIVSVLGGGSGGGLRPPKPPAFAIGRDSNPNSSSFSMAFDSLPPQSSRQTEEEQEGR